MERKAAQKNKNTLEELKQGLYRHNYNETHNKQFWYKKNTASSKQKFASRRIIISGV